MDENDREGPPSSEGDPSSRDPQPTSRDLPTRREPWPTSASIPPPPGADREPPPRRPGEPRRRSRPWRWLRRLLVAIVLGLAGLFLLGLAGIFFFGAPLVVEEGAWIELRFSPSYPEQRPDRRGLDAILSPRELSAQDVHDALRRAEVDPRVAGIILRPDGFPGGWAQAHELRERLASLRTKGKRVVAWVGAPGSVDYYLATVADRIHLAPEGMVLAEGLRAELMFVRDGLEKIGVRFDAVAVGEYKSAPEMLTQDASSAANRQQVMDYLDDVFGLMVEGISQGRGLTEQRVRTLVDRAIHDPSQALAEGMIDAIQTFEDLVRELGDPQMLSPLAYLSAAGEEEHRGDPGEVAVVYVTGTIVGGRSGSEGLGGASTGHETVIERLRSARAEESVKAVVLRIDSPGGSALASDLIWREVVRTRQEKPVVVSMAESAASGGYYVAMDADAVFADPVTLTGSIGVFLLSPDLSGLYEKLGVRTETFRRGERAGFLDATHRIDPATRARLEEQLVGFYDRFVERVAEGRGLDREVAALHARGRVWSGRRAMDVSLVDELGGLEQAIRHAANLGGIDERVRPRVVTFQPEPSFLDTALERWMADQVAARPLRVESPLWQALEPLQRADGVASTMDGRPQFMLPWRLRIR